MKKLVIGAVLSLLPAAALGKGPRSHSLDVAVPAAPILAAARKTGIALQFPLGGEIVCQRVEQDIFPPYTPAAWCDLTLFDRPSRTEHYAEIADYFPVLYALMEKVPPQGNYYRIEGAVFIRSSDADTATMTVPDAR